MCIRAGLQADQAWLYKLAKLSTSCSMLAEVALCAGLQIGQALMCTLLRLLQHATVFVLSCRMTRHLEPAWPCT